MLSPSDALTVLPSTLRSELVDAYERIVNNFAERRWEPSELNGGKICEITYSIAEGYLSGGYPQKSHKPPNMVDACNSLASRFPKGNRSAKIQIPRMIIALNELRNNRGVGHVGGDVSPNEMDAMVVLYMAKWLLSEIIRLIHSISTEEAAAVVEVLVQRQLPVVWSHQDIRRVLRPELELREQVLVLLLHQNPCGFSDLVRWLEHKTPHNLKRQTLYQLHIKRFIEFDRNSGIIHLLPPGVAEAERVVKNSLAKNESEH